MDMNTQALSPGYSGTTRSDDLWQHIYDSSHIDGLVQDCSISIAKALEILQFCTKLSILTIKNKPSRWPSARLQYLQCIGNGDTADLH